MPWYENEPEFVAYAKGPGDTRFHRVPVTIDSVPEAKYELSVRVDVPTSDIEIDRIEPR